MALAQEGAIRTGAPGLPGELVELALFAIATVTDVVAACVLVRREAGLHAYVAAPAAWDALGLVETARSRLAAESPEAGAGDIAFSRVVAPLEGVAGESAWPDERVLRSDGRALGVVYVLRRAPAESGAAVALDRAAGALAATLADEGGPAATTEPGPAFLALAEATGLGLAVADEGGRLRPLNTAGARLLEGMGGEPGEAPTAVREALAAARGREVVLREVTVQSPALRHLTVAACLVDGQGLVSLRDHTEEKLLQERLLQSEKMASVGQLVSGVAHELNNPLTGVMGFAQLLLARDLDPTVRSQVETIYGEAERAAKIVQNLLSFARRRKPSKEMADVNLLLQRVLELRSYDFAIRNIALDMTFDARAPRVWVDPDQVQQVFFNVIKNAEQAMIEAQGKGRLSVATAATPEGVRVTIADDGPGIPADIQRRIFDPFFTTKEAGQGTGLGLTICYGIIDEHGGRIWAEDAPGGGAAFVIDLPRGRPEVATGEAEGARPTARTTPVRGRRVLVVDDEESIRLLLHDILDLDSHSVATASSGLEALERVRQERFDVVITDMKMPGMDGASFYRAVREHDPDQARRIVFITGDTVNPETRAFLQQVQNPVLAKPFKIGPLREAMEAVLRG